MIQFFTQLPIDCFDFMKAHVGFLIVLFAIGVVGGAISARQH